MGWHEGLDALAESADGGGDGERAKGDFIGASAVREVAGRDPEFEGDVRGRFLGRHVVGMSTTNVGACDCRGSKNV